MIELKISQSFDHETAQYIYCISRVDGELLMPADGIVSLNYSTLDNAIEMLPKIKKHINNGGGQL